MPIIVIGIVFGLAMDYQVFLVTRMREAYVHGADGAGRGRRRVPAQRPGGHRRRDDHDLGLRGFMLAGRPADQVDRLRARRGVFFDAFVVRMVLIPAVMYLLGDAAWWLPTWLDRLLPNVDVEGEKLAAMRVPDDAREVEDERQPVR